MSIYGKNRTSQLLNDQYYLKKPKACTDTYLSMKKNNCYLYCRHFTHTRLSHNENTI